MKKIPLFEMKTSIKLILIHLTVLSCVRCDEITVKGSVGGDAVINCPSQKGYESYPKYLLKGWYKNGVEVIRSDGHSEWTHRGRVSLQDKEDKEDKKDRNIFTVTIHDLTLEDAGTYGCGVDTWGSDYYIIVKLNIAKKSKPQPAVITTATPGVTTATPATTSGTAPVLVVSLSLAAVVCAVLLFALYKWRQRKHLVPDDSAVTHIYHLPNPGVGLNDIELDPTGKSGQTTSDYERMDPIVNNNDPVYESTHNPVYQQLGAPSVTVNESIAKHGHCSQSDAANS